jgi:hypothetical protein
MLAAAHAPCEWDPLVIQVVVPVTAALYQLHYLE